MIIAGRGPPARSRQRRRHSHCRPRSPWTRTHTPWPASLSPPSRISPLPWRSQRKGCSGRRSHMRRAGHRPDRHLRSSPPWVPGDPHQPTSQTSRSQELRWCRSARLFWQRGPASRGWTDCGSWLYGSTCTGQFLLQPFEETAGTYFERWDSGMGRVRGRFTFPSYFWGRAIRPPYAHLALRSWSRLASLPAWRRSLTRRDSDMMNMVEVWYGMQELSG